MVRRRLLAAIAGALLVSQFVPTSAGAFNPCDHRDNTLITAGPVYIDVRYVGEPFGEQVWVYLESNDVDDLQRGGSAMVGGHNDQCPDATTRPDTLVF